MLKFYIGVKMAKNKIQEERMINYFKDAAKELIRGEGLAVISARNVAERAGYSYATLYNYFKDIRDLVFSCAEDFMDECMKYVVKNTNDMLPGRERLKKIIQEYAKFFVQYPGIYELLYFEKIKVLSTKNSDIQEIRMFLLSLIEDDLNELKFNDMQKEVFNYTLSGYFNEYLSRRNDMDYKLFNDKLIEIINHLIDF